MKRRFVWLGLMAGGGAALVAGLGRHYARTSAGLPAPRETRSASVYAPPVPLEVPPPPPAPGASDHPGLQVVVEGGVPGGVVGGVVGGVPGGVVGGGVQGGKVATPPSAPRRRSGERQLHARVLAAPGAAHDLAYGIRRETESFRAPRAPVDREGYDHIRDNPFLAVAVHPLSTFSIDVDTASYANVRRFLTDGRLPPKDAVRIEELVNYFRYDYPEPRGDTPFSLTTELAACPWEPEHRLALVGLRGRSIDHRDVPPRNLTFLLDVSGSMGTPDKLPLLRRAMALLVDTLREEDQVAIVVYAGASGLVLPPTSGAHRAHIEMALDSLRAGGSTAGGAGIELAYSVAADSYVEGGLNRVVLATDGDFNVGLSSEGELVRLIEEKRKSGVFLSVLGFGRGNLQDSKMEKLADHGNGNYAYIDSLAEAEKVLVTEAGGTLVTIAKDVKIQVEFNPARVQAYRLIGYENRALRAEDFADDGRDAGEIGAGHTVTALYEIIPVGVDMDLPAVDPLKYQRPGTSSPGGASGELMTVKLRHKEPDAERSLLTSVAVEDVRPDRRPSANLRFASAVAAFGMLLRESEHRGAASWDQVIDLAGEALDDNPDGYRAEFLALARKARELSGGAQVAIAR